LAVNLAGPVLLNHHLTDHLAKSASIVVVASITAQRCTMADAELVALVRGGFAAVPAAATGLDGVAAYQLSKKAILCWMGLAVRALHPSGTRINAVSPGPVETPILADFETSIGKDRIDASAALTGRHGQPEEIAAVIAWLLGLDASWINGVDIRADGGYHVLRTAVALAEAKWS
jgi:NAD(P)-dependent dehydrogenase (short-subunit alcohol dehydrogenase family)